MQKIEGQLAAFGGNGEGSCAELSLELYIHADDPSRPFHRLYMPDKPDCFQYAVTENSNQEKSVGFPPHLYSR